MIWNLPPRATTLRRKYHESFICYGLKILNHTQLYKIEMVALFYGWRLEDSNTQGELMR